MQRIWLRSEIKAFEKRTPLIPTHAKELIKKGFKVFVEKSAKRIYRDEDYKKAGCQLVESDTWESAPQDAYILGIKELPNKSTPINHKHIYFAHVYKGQSESKEILDRFRKGGGQLFDLEYLTNHQGKRVTSFGFWSGVAGAGVSLLTWCQKNQGLKAPFKIKDHYPSSALLLDELYELLSGSRKKPNSLLIGHKGRCGRGVKSLLDKLDIENTLWGREETQNKKAFPEILGHDILLNCVFVDKKIPPFVTLDMLKNNKKLSVIGDISCDPSSSFNPLPLYKHVTTFDKPTYPVVTGKQAVDLIAIDHLPSFLPKESSDDFSEQLLPFLFQLKNKIEANSVWSRSKEIFTKHL